MLNLREIQQLLGLINTVVKLPFFVAKRWLPAVLQFNLVSSFPSISAASEVTVSAQLLFPDGAINRKHICRPENLLSVWALVGDNLVQNESFAELPSSIFFFLSCSSSARVCVCVCAHARTRCVLFFILSTKTLILLAKWRHFGKRGKFSWSAQLQRAVWGLDLVEVNQPNPTSHLTP